MSHRRCGRSSSTSRRRCSRAIERDQQKASCPAARSTIRLRPNLHGSDARSTAQRATADEIARGRDAARRHAIQDEIVTVRNDRFVIPVKTDFRGKVGGVAHGFSSSGQTVFVEPLEAIEANNELQNLKGKEEREIARILFALTEQASRTAPRRRSRPSRPSPNSIS